MSFADRFNEALLGYLHKTGINNAVKVTGHEQHEADSYFSGCDTCGYGADETTFSIFYIDANADPHTKVYYSSMADIINALD